MTDDFRTRFKTRELMTEWLNLTRLSDISKDDERFPGFDARLTDELKSSLYEFLDSVVWSETSDYRQLFSTVPVIDTPSAPEFYQTAATETDGSDSVRTLGLLAHPYLMSGLAYRDSTSPIHRGVFLIRHLLGRTIRPPNAAFTPLSPDLHPDLTTRERVQLQTSPVGCQVCHRKINGLGFVLENLDAVGRYRTEEHGQPVEPTGFYEARSGEEVPFDGPASLAEFLATSDDAHRAFVQRAFLHFVKQPPGAWGADTLDRLTGTFRDNQFSIRALLVEIALTAAQPPQQTAEPPAGGEVSQTSGNVQ